MPITLFRQIANEVKEILLPDLARKYGLHLRIIAKEKVIEFVKHENGVYFNTGTCLEDYCFEGLGSGVGYHELEKVLTILAIVEGSRDAEALGFFQDYSTISDHREYPVPGWKLPRKEKRSFYDGYTIPQFITDLRRGIEEESLPFFNAWKDMRSYYQLLLHNRDWFVEEEDNYSGERNAESMSMSTYLPDIQLATLRALLHEGDYQEIIEAQKDFYSRYRREDGDFVPRYHSLLTLTRLLNEFTTTGAIALPPVQALLTKTYY